MLYSLLRKTGRLIQTVSRIPATWLLLCGVWSGLLLVPVFSTVGQTGSGCPYPVMTVLAGCALLGTEHAGPVSREMGQLVCTLGRPGF